MSTQTFLAEPLRQYLLEISCREPEILRQLRQETATLETAVMQISPEQGQLMAMLIRLLGARKALEIGVFTGYSSLSVALALPPDGQLIACDIDETSTAMARGYWQRAGVAERIDLRLAPARQTLASLLADGAAGTFDFAFIDADKESYSAYYELCLELLRRGGLIAVDNVLWQGKLIDETNHDPDTVAIRHFNAALRDDARIDLCLVPIGDGLTLARKR